jgi:hypothetical protein
MDDQWFMRLTIENCWFDQWYVNINDPCCFLITDDQWFLGLIYFNWEWLMVIDVDLRSINFHIWLMMLEIDGDW